MIHIARTAQLLHMQRVLQHPAPIFELHLDVEDAWAGDIVETLEIGLFVDVELLVVELLLQLEFAVGDHDFAVAALAELHCALQAGALFHLHLVNLE